MTHGRKLGFRFLVAAALTVLVGIVFVEDHCITRPIAWVTWFNDCLRVSIDMPVAPLDESHAWQEGVIEFDFRFALLFAGVLCALAVCWIFELIEVPGFFLPPPPLPKPKFPGCGNRSHADDDEDAR